MTVISWQIILINTAIIVGALIIWFGNHYFEERELNEINEQIALNKFNFVEVPVNIRYTDYSL